MDCGLHFVMYNRNNEFETWFWAYKKYMFISLRLEHSKDIKISQTEIPLKDRNVFEFFCVSMYTNCPTFIKFSRTFPVRRTFKIPNSNFLLLSTCELGLKLTQTHAHTFQAISEVFGLKRPQNALLHQKFNFENFTQKQYFFYHIWAKEIKRAV